MRRQLLATAAVVALGVPIFAAVGASASTEGNSNACFGQDRAAGVQGLKDAGIAPGQGFASIRKGDNAEINAEYKSTVCGK